MTDRIRKYKIRKLKRRLDRKLNLDREFNEEDVNRVPAGSPDGAGGQFTFKDVSWTLPWNTSETSPKERLDRFKKPLEFGDNYTDGKPENPEGYYGYYDGNEHWAHSYKNADPSLFCAVSPAVIDHLFDEGIERTIYDYQDENNARTLESALSSVKVSPNPTENDTNAEEKRHASAYFSPSDDCIHLSKSPRGSIVDKARVVAHESMHSYDYSLCGSTRYYSVEFKRYAFATAIKSDVGDFLKKFGYSDDCDPNLVRDKIIEELSNQGISVYHSTGLSDMIDAYTNGKLNLGTGHSLYGEDYWKKDPSNLEIEGYADFGGGLADEGERKALQFAIPNAYSVFSDMNMFAESCKKYPILQFFDKGDMSIDCVMTPNYRKNEVNTARKEIKSRLKTVRVAIQQFDDEKTDDLVTGIIDHLPQYAPMTIKVNEGVYGNEIVPSSRLTIISGHTLDRPDSYSTVVYDEDQKKIIAADSANYASNPDSRVFQLLKSGLRHGGKVSLRFYAPNNEEFPNEIHEIK